MSDQEVNIIKRELAFAMATMDLPTIRRPQDRYDEAAAAIEKLIDHKIAKAIADAFLVDTLKDDVP